MRKLVAFIAAIGLCDVTLAWADIYRCDHDGKLQFTDKPCAAGQDPAIIAPLNTLETSAGDRALAQAFDAETAALRSSREVPSDKPPKRADAGVKKDSKPRKERKPSSKKTPKTAKASRAPPPQKLTLRRDREDRDRR
jgi:hypothetical protein